MISECGLMRATGRLGRVGTAFIFVTRVTSRIGPALILTAPHTDGAFLRFWRPTVPVA